MANEKTKFKIEEQIDASATLTTSDLKYILDVNKKAIEIYIEVDKQNEKILETFDNFKEIYDSIQEELEILKKNEANIERLLSGDNNEDHKKIIANLTEFKKTFGQMEITDSKVKEMVENIEKKIEEIEKNLFRLVLILGSTGIGAIITAVAGLLKK
ncbi:MAG: hypothetical protein AABY22_05330 [Nanoarchaeota archaeon]